MSVLDHIGLPSAPPALVPPRLQTDLDFDFDFDFDHDFDFDLSQSRDVNSVGYGKQERNADWDARPPPHLAAGSAGSPSHYAIGDADDPADNDAYQGH